MRLSEKFKYDPFATPVGKFKDVTATFTGKIIEMTEEQLNALKDGEFDETSIIFNVDGEEYPLKLRNARKHESDVTGEITYEDYSFVINFINGMIQVANLSGKQCKSLDTAIKSLTGKEFTIRVTKTEKDAPNYKVVDPNSEKATANGKSTYTAY